MENISAVSCEIRGTYTFVAQHVTLKVLIHIYVTSNIVY
jgi:hypothetical protein